MKNMKNRAYLSGRRLIHVGHDDGVVVILVQKPNFEGIFVLFSFVSIDMREGVSHSENIKMGCLLSDEKVTERGKRGRRENRRITVRREEELYVCTC